MVMLQIRIPSELARRLDHMAIDEGLYRSGLVLRIVTEWLDAHAPTPPAAQAAPHDEGEGG
jgi:hypothetical protein